MNLYGELIKGTKVLHGRGIYIDKKLGLIYRGYFFDNSPHIKSECIYTDEGSYKGEIRSSFKFGHGKEILPNGNEYNGEFENGCFNGYGELKYNNGNYYKEEFRNNMKFGVGEFFNKRKGTTYEWQWLNELKN